MGVTFVYKVISFLRGRSHVLSTRARRYAHAPLSIGALAGFVPRSSGPVLFLGATSGVVVQDGRIVVGACGELAVVGDGRRVRCFILGVVEDSAGGFTAVGAFERDLEVHVE